MYRSRAPRGLPCARRSPARPCSPMWRTDATSLLPPARSLSPSPPCSLSRSRPRERTKSPLPSRPSSLVVVAPSPTALLRYTELSIGCTLDWTSSLAFSSSLQAAGAPSLPIRAVSSRRLLWSAARGLSPSGPRPSAGSRGPLWP